jgi:hypothetical protein
MDRYEQILNSLPGLDKRLEKAGFAKWLGEQRKVEVDGQPYVVLAGDRFASEAEAAITFALEHGLVAPEQVRIAEARQPLPDDVEAVDIDLPKGDE